MSNLFEYKGYLGSAEVDAESRVLVGKLLFIRDVISYSAAGVDELEVAFKEAVDDYLATCAELGDEPDVPCKGSFNVRIPPELHRDISILARNRGIKLNEFVCQALLITAKVAPRVEQHVHEHNHKILVTFDGVAPSEAFVATSTSPTEWGGRLATKH